MHSTITRQVTANAALPSPETLPVSAPNDRLATNPQLLALALVIITIVAYVPLRHAGFIWDDDIHVTDNANLRSLHGLHQIWFAPTTSPQYYPLQLTGYWVEYQLWGLWPFGFHAVNVLLHALNAILLWLALRRLDLRGAWLAAAVFAVHPIQVESVAWVSELKNLLSTTFYLAAFLAYVRFRPLTGGMQAHSEHGSRYALAMALFLCALLSKTVACSLPAVLLLLLRWKKGRVESQDVTALTPMFVLGLAFGLATAWLEKYHIGASGSEWSLSVLQRCLLAGRAPWFYAGKLIWPHPLIFVYPHWAIDPTAWRQYWFPFSALALLLWLWMLRRRIGRGPLVAVLCFVTALAPALGFVDVFPFRYSYVADHFSYLASMAFVALAAGGLFALVRQPHLRVLLSSAVLISFSWQTWQRSAEFHDNETLWVDTLRENPSAALAHNNLGNLYESNGRLHQALFHLQRAAQLEPNYPQVHNNLGIVLARLNRPADAAKEFAEALRLAPDNAVVHLNFAHVLERLGQTDQAIQHLRAAVQAGVADADDYLDLSRLLEKAGRYAEAIHILRTAHNAVPSHLHLANELAWLLATCPDPHLRQSDQAVQLSEQLCVRTQYRIPELLDTLAAAYAASGSFRDAVRIARQAADLTDSQHRPQLSALIRYRLAGYEQHQPALSPTPQ